MLAGVQQGTRVYYRYGSEVGGWSSEASFIAPHTPPPPAAPSAAAARIGASQASAQSTKPRPVRVAYTTRLLAFGDLGQHSPDDAFQHCDCKASLRTTDAMQRLVRVGAEGGEFVDP